MIVQLCLFMFFALHLLGVVLFNVRNLFCCNGGTSSCD